MVCTAAPDVRREAATKFKVSKVMRYGRSRRLRRPLVVGAGPRPAVRLYRGNGPAAVAVIHQRHMYLHSCIPDRDQIL